MDTEYVSSVINSGGVVIMPTDTVYGIMADALNEVAVRKIYEIKGRDYNKPLIVLVNSYKMLNKYTENITKLENKLIKEFFPGPLTIILKKNENINELITAGGDTVGVRIPNNKELLEIISKLDRPIVSSSANVSDEDVITDISMLNDELVTHVDYIYDGGKILNKSSTIIKVENEIVKILRDGELAEVIKEKYII